MATYFIVCVTCGEKRKLESVLPDKQSAEEVRSVCPKCVAKSILKNCKGYRRKGGEQDLSLFEYHKKKV